MPAATTSAIIIPACPPIRYPTPMNRAVMKASNMAVRIRFMCRLHQAGRQTRGTAFLFGGRRTMIWEFDRPIQYSWSETTMQQADNDNSAVLDDDAASVAPRKPLS